MQVSEIFQLLWTLKIVPSAAVCAWRLLLDRLPTRLNLAKRGMQLTDLPCPLCQEYEESGQHLFTTCKVAQNVWDQCKRWVGNVNVRHESITIHFQSFGLVSWRQCVNLAWKEMWVAIVTELWNHRNKVIFNRELVYATEIFTLAQLKGWCWLKNKFKRVAFSYSDWHFAPLKCLDTLD